MAKRLFTNNASTTLATGISNSALSLTVASGDGAKFPALSGTDVFYATLSSGTPESAWEIVKVTARSTDTFTIVRAQDGTSAAAWNAGATVSLRAIAGELSDYEALLVSKGAASGLATLDSSAHRTIGEAQQPTTVATTTSTISPGVYATADITMSKFATITKIQVDYPAWVRIYQTSAYRTADASRLITDDPVAGAGVVGDIYITPAGTTDLQPVFDFVNADTSQGTTAYIAIVNKDTVNRAITTTFTYRPEA